MRHLIVCCDGTWNRADQVHDGVPTPTNVRLFHNLLARTCRCDTTHDQTVQYFSGVGADGSRLARLFDGGTGHGLARNIMNAYLWLARTYQPGDSITAVGFSRGAYTVRSLVAMLTSCGLVKVPASGVDPQKSWRSVQQVFERGYLPRTRKDDWSDGLRFLDGFAPPRTDADRERLGEKIEFLGVWDTVGSLGVPDSMGFLNLFDDHDDYAFQDTHLNPGVRCARHAVALDERRGPFAPTLWTTEDGEALQEPPRVVQLWFPGVHSDVGGGYREHGLADGALRWMLDEASAHTRLGFGAQAEKIEGDPFDVLHDSCVGPYERISPVPRSVPRVAERAEHVHSSAVERHLDPPVRQDPYRLGDDVPLHGRCRATVYAHKVWNETGLYLVEGTYRLTATGEWTDRDEAADPAGVGDPSFLGRLAYRYGDVAGGVESAWQDLTDNPVVDVPFSKRVEKAKWMELVVGIANGAFDSVGRPCPPQLEPVGRGPTTLTVTAPGYLYAFANDAWGMYSNNRGSVELTIERVA